MQSCNRRKEGHHQPFAQPKGGQRNVEGERDARLPRQAAPRLPCEQVTTTAGIEEPLKGTSQSSGVSHASARTAAKSSQNEYCVRVRVRVWVAAGREGCGAGAPRAPRAAVRWDFLIMRDPTTFFHTRDPMRGSCRCRAGGNLARGDWRTTRTAMCCSGKRDALD